MLPQLFAYGYFYVKITEFGCKRSARPHINYAWGADYHDIMTPRLEELAGWLSSELNDDSFAHRVYVDTGAILERDHAESAGLGSRAKTRCLSGRSMDRGFLGEF